MRPPKKKEIWLINFSQRDVALRDLNITVRRGSRVNLLSNHYNFTEEQIYASSNTGSIHKKSRMVCIREKLPPSHLNYGKVKEVASRKVLKPLRNPKVETVAPYMEELDILEDDNSIFSMTDEQFAAKEADIETQERAPTLAVDAVYTNPPTEEDS